jgi:hypothetical protein
MRKLLQFLALALIHAVAHAGTVECQWEGLSGSFAISGGQVGNNNGIGSGCDRGLDPSVVAPQKTRVIQFSRVPLDVPQIIDVRIGMSPEPVTIMRWQGLASRPAHLNEIDPLPRYREYVLPTPQSFTLSVKYPNLYLTYLSKGHPEIVSIDVANSYEGAFLRLRTSLKFNDGEAVLMVHAGPQTIGLHRPLGSIHPEVWQAEGVQRLLDRGLLPPEFRVRLCATSHPSNDLTNFAPCQIPFTPN